MKPESLAPRLEAQELRWRLPDLGAVTCYHREGEGRPLLLLHSINAAPSAFEVSPFFRDMHLRMPLYAPDLPGFGRSERPDRPYLPEFFAQCIEAMIREIGAPSVDILALSTTCEFAARVALSSPEWVNSLIFVSPTGLSRRRAAPGTIGPRVHRVLRLPLLGAGLYRLLRTRPSIRFFLDKAFADGAPAEMVDYAHETAAQPGASHAPFYFLSGQLFNHDAVGNLYLPLQVPVLMLYDRDPNIGFDCLPQVLEGNPAWRVQRIEGTLGLPQFERPAATEAALTDFLATTGRATDART